MPETQPPAREEKPKPVKDQPSETQVKEPEGKDPTRYGDWEKNGRCIDF